MKFTKWVNKNFGFGIENYSSEQVETLRNFLIASLSNQFGYVERKSLVKIMDKIAKLDNDELDKIKDEMEF